MRKIAGAVLMAVVLICVVAMPALAAAWYSDIAVNNTTSTSYTMLPLMCDLDTVYLATNGYMSASGLDTLMGAGSYPHMLADDKLLFADAVPASSSTVIEFTTDNAALASFYTIVGYNGHITTADNAQLELGNNFIVEQKGYVDTTAGTDKDLVYKPAAYKTYVSAGNTISSQILGYGAVAATANPAVAFPVVAATNGGDNAVNSTSHTVNLPAGIASGNLLIVFFCTDGIPTITFPGGWTELGTETDGVNGTKTGYYYRIADGTEGPTITVTTSQAQMTAHTSYRITGYSGLPEFEDDKDAGAGVNPDPPNLIPSWGSQNNLWIAACGYDDGSVNVTVYPAGYGGGRNDRSNNIEGVGVGSATRSLIAVSEDPGAFTISAARNWVGTTIVIKPLAGGGMNNVASTSHQIYLPDSITAGDLLVVFFSCDWNPTITFPSGWTQLFSTANGANVTLGCWYRVADGTETGLTAQTSVSVMSAHTTYRITGYSGVPEAGVAATGNNVNPDPPNLAPSWGAENTLWFAACGYDTNVTVTGYPAGYGNNRNDYADDAAGCGTGLGNRQLNAAAENPAAFTISGADDWVANTVAVAPADGAVVTATVAGVTSGLRTVKTIADTVNLTLEVYDEDDVLIGTNSAALGGASVPNNVFDWYWNLNTVMPYITYTKLTSPVGGLTEKLWYQPVSYIVGTALPDRDLGDGAQDGVIVWGWNPLGVSAFAGGILPVVTGEMEEPAPPPDVAPEIGPPSDDMYPNEEEMEGTAVTWLHPIVQNMSQTTNTPIVEIWWFLCAVFVLLFMAAVHRFVPNMLLTGLSGIVAMGFCVGMAFLPAWFIILASLFVIGLIVMERSPAI